MSKKRDREKAVRILARTLSGDTLYRGSCRKRTGKGAIEPLGFELTGTESGKVPGNEDFSVEVNLLERKIDG